eukprot:scaffold75671_cov21-Tisochrysis_lutea.AAC.1
MYALCSLCALCPCSPHTYPSQKCCGEAVKLSRKSRQAQTTRISLIANGNKTSMLIQNSTEARRLDLGLLPHKLNEHLFCAIDLDCDLRCLANSPVAFAASNKHRTPRTTNYCARYQKGTVLRTIVCMPDTHTPILGLVASQKVTVKNISQAVPRTPHVLAAHMLALTVIHCLWRTHICGASFVTYPHKDIVHM